MKRVIVHEEEICQERLKKESIEKSRAYFCLICLPLSVIILLKNLEKLLQTLHSEWKKRYDNVHT